MNKYQTFKVLDPYENVELTYVTIRFEDTTGKTFPADKSNQDYVQFLTDAQLTDAKVKKLTPNVWYDFPAPVEEVVPVVEEVVEAI